MSLPDAEARSPECGVCWSDTDGGDGDFVCHPCGLVFDAVTMAASFLNPDTPACGKPCDIPWHGDHKIRPGKGYRCGACELPAGHQSPHWADCRMIDITERER